MKIGPLGKMAKVFGIRSWKGALKVYGDVKLSWGLKVSCKRGGLDVETNRDRDRERP
jgi:hypothetical protein